MASAEPQTPHGGYVTRILCGNANRKLAEEVSHKMGVPLELCHVRSFADGELDINIETNVRGSDVFVIQSTCPPIHNNIMELLLLIHTLKLSSPKRITAVIPYYGYARQDHKTRPRVPIAASAIAQLIEKMGPHRVVTVDLHSGQIQGFFHQTPVDNLLSEPEFVKYIKQKNIPLEKTVIVSPDAAGVARTRRFADGLGVYSVATILKRTVNHVEQTQIVGEVKDCICIVFDDMIDTAGTMTTAAQCLKDNGASRVIACATHGVFSGLAIERINSSILEEVCVTDSIPQEENAKRCNKLVVLSLVNLITESIRHLHDEKSLSILFAPPKKI